MTLCTGKDSDEHHWWPVLGAGGPKRREPHPGQVQEETHEILSWGLRSANITQLRDRRWPRAGSAGPGNTHTEMKRKSRAGDLEPHTLGSAPSASHARQVAVSPNLTSQEGIRPQHHAHSASPVGVCRGPQPNERRYPQCRPGVASAHFPAAGPGARMHMRKHSKSGLQLKTPSGWGMNES